MRRRDATDHARGFSKRRPTVVSVALSLGLHAALLGAVTHARWSPVPPLGLIRIALATGGAAGNHGVSAPARAAAPPARNGSDTNEPQRARAATRQRRHDTAAGSFTDAAADHRAASIGMDTSSAGAHGSAGAAAGSGNGTGGGAGGDGDMDQRARCVYCPAPHYPLIARARGWEGTVDIGLSLLADGSVDTAKLRRSSGYGVLDDAAVAVARRSRFTPPAAHEFAAPLRGRIEYRFELTTSH